ncbi:MAG: hypothetical protein ABIG89_03990 [Candidatus Woesearchaeota archaeon]
MRDLHLQSLEKWAHFVRNNPDKWKSIHTKFINAQFEKHREFLKRLLKLPDGEDKIIKLYNIKNISGYPNLLKKKNQKLNK